MLDMEGGLAFLLVLILKQNLLNSTEIQQGSLVSASQRNNK